jgi:hypothetical protein
MLGPLRGHPRGRELPQLVVDERQQIAVAAARSLVISDISAGLTVVSQRETEAFSTPAPDGLGGHGLAAAARKRPGGSACIGIVRRRASPLYPASA